MSMIIYIIYLHKINIKKSEKNIVQTNMRQAAIRLISLL